MEQLAKLVEKAKAIPLTDQVRVNRRKAYFLTEEMRATLPAELGAEFSDLPQPALDFLVLTNRLDDLVHHARAVPLTSDVRFERTEIADLVAQMQAKLAQVFDAATP
jgi:hypothetical protein